ncbi:hypothetical protein [Streptomyces venezuelae]|uniref:hypothetical protein n=1 Tax=Streptomyces venezuelae TaxID=54571 RepID=UPI001CC24677|nr:hypothetical protein [Streptomyces venezuelae]
MSLLLTTAVHRYPIEFLLAFSLSLAATCVFPAVVYSFFWTGFNRHGLLWLVYGGLSLCTLLTLASPAVSGTKYALLPEQDFNLFPLHTPRPDLRTGGLPPRMARQQASLGADHTPPAHGAGARFCP